jgi:ABC-type sugar transport system permease subunit
MRDRERAGSHVAGRPSGRPRRWGDRLAPYLFISPFLVSFLALFLGPALYALVLSFFRYAGYGKATWVGFRNFRIILAYDVFWIEMRNIVFYWVAHAIPMVFLAFGLAVLVNSRLVTRKNFFKPVIFVPQVVASVAAALLFQCFFGTKYGILNHLLGTQIPWLTDMDLARWPVVILLVWRGTGYWFVICLAGLTTIGAEIMEAAIVDGATAWQRLTRITIPLMRKTFLFIFVVDAIVTLRLFAEPNVLAGKPGTLAPVEMAPVINLVVENVRNAQFGLAAATGWLLFVAIACVSWVQFRILQGRGEER